MVFIACAPYLTCANSYLFDSDSSSLSLSVVPALIRDEQGFNRFSATGIVAMSQCPDRFHPVRAVRLSDRAKLVPGSRDA